MSEIPEIELLRRRVNLLTNLLVTDSDAADAIVDRIASNREQRDRAIKRIETLVLEEAVNYPSFIALEEAA